MRRMLIVIACLTLCLVSCAGNPNPSVNLDDAEARGDGIVAPETAKGTVTLLTMKDYSPPDDMQARIVAHTNDMLAEAGLGIELNVVALPMQSYVNTVVADPDSYDLCFVPGSMLGGWVQKQVFADLSAYFDAYPDLYALSPPEAWNSTRVSGGCYTFPLVEVIDFSGAWETGFLYREDIFRQLNAQLPNDPYELLQIAETARDQGLDYKIAYFYPGGTPPYALHVTYDTWPFYVSEDSLFLYREDGTVDIYAYTEEYKQDVQILQMLTKAGVLLPVNNYDELNELTAAWDFAAAFYPVGYSFRNAEHAEDIALHQFEPQKGRFRILPYSSNGISISAKANVEDAISFLTALYSNQKVYDSFLYGEEGKDWHLQEDGSYREVTEVGNSSMYYHYTLDRPIANMPEKVIFAPAANPIQFPAAQFYPDFDAELYNSVINHSGYRSQNGIISLRAGIVSEDMSQRVFDLFAQSDIEALHKVCQEQYSAYFDSVLE